MNSGHLPPSIGTPRSEITIDLPLVRRLLEEQHPDLAYLPLSLVDQGWDNAIFRLGDLWAVRMPRRQIGAALIEHEQDWLPKLAGQLAIPVPNPYRLGSPNKDYPWRWSIVPWFSGVSADQRAPAVSQAPRWGEFLRSLHVPAPADAPVNPFRSVPLQQRATFTEERIRRLEQKTNLITPGIKRIWNQGVDAPMDVETSWIHGDLHPRNILVEDGVITAVIDWGDITVGDRATDLASLWMLFSDSEARQQVIAAYGPISEKTLHRARGWAVFFGVALLDAGLVDSPAQALMGEKILWQVQASDRAG